MRERTCRIRDSAAHALTHPSLRVLVPAALPAPHVRCTPTHPSASSPSIYLRPRAASPAQKPSGSQALLTLFPLPGMTFHPPLVSPLFKRAST